MITRISVQNFKSIKRMSRLVLKPLTILTGVNASGKSSIMEVISFFAQAARLHGTAGSSEAAVPLRIFTGGDLRRYPHQIENFIPYKKNPRAAIELRITIEPDDDLTARIRMALEGVQLSKTLASLFKEKTEIESVGYSFRFRISTGVYSQRIDVNGRSLIRVRSFRGSPIVAAEVTQPNEFHGKRMRNSAEEVFGVGAFKPSEPATEDQNLKLVSGIAQHILEYIRLRAENMFLISGERGKIDPEVRISERPPREIQPSWVGVNGQYLMEILSRCMTREPDKFAKIQKWANRFQLGNIRAGYIGGALLESNFRDSTLNVDLNSTLAGLGSRQVLSMITQIFWSDPGSVIMIEEPEISLHPENQVLLHELFSEAVAEGKQIVCSTHSPFFVLAISRIIKKKLLPLGKIAVYEVEKDKDGTHVKALKLNEHGFIVKGVPSFMRVEKELFKDWSETLEDS